MKSTTRKKKYANSLWAILLPLVVFCALGVFFAIERTGLSFTGKEDSKNTGLLAPDSIIPRANHKPDMQCLVIKNSSANDYGLTPNLLFVLNQMSVGYTLWDIIGKNYELPDLSSYKTVIITFEDIKPLYPTLQNLFNWVKKGGGLLFACSPNDRVLSTVFYEEMGVERGIYSFIPQLVATLNTDFMPGGRNIKIAWSDEEKVEEYREGINYLLNESSIVHMTGTGPKGTTPMLWETKTGSGRVVVNNNDAFTERWSRGLIAAAYSIVEPAVAWPVINASLFFIDDFPAPIPSGFNEFIKRDYGVQTEYFYTHIWFPDILSMAEKHKIKYTSVFIETYNDNVTPPFTPPPDTERMKYFGTLFLDEGHEIGLHGYDHQSLVFQNFDYKGELPYNKWQKEEDVVQALSETIRLQHQLFPGIEMRTYVPPSNVLAPESRAILKKHFPEITVISDLLIEDIFQLYSDFGVADDGFINIPRIASGYALMGDDINDQDFWSVLNEITLHFVNSHFIHPDDAMDPERGAEKGWKSLSASFEKFLSWLDEFPIRNMTAQEAAPAVERFDNLTVHTTLKNTEMDLDLDGFIDEAYLLVRINDGVPGSTMGGSLILVSEKLYLLKAENAHVVIQLAPGASS